MALKILVTNDDGVYAPAFAKLVKWASKYGEVTAVAPKVEQSGKSHAIDFTRPIEIKKVQLEEGVFAFTQHILEFTVYVMQAQLLVANLEHRYLLCKILVLQKGFERAIA